MGDIWLSPLFIIQSMMGVLSQGDFHCKKVLITQLQQRKHSAVNSQKTNQNNNHTICLVGSVIMRQDVESVH